MDRELWEKGLKARKSTLGAALAARGSVAQVNRSRAAASMPTTDMYLALHIGEVFYGNIGSEDRLDFNRRAVTWARTNGKPTVGNTDLHLLEQMGTTYSMVDATPEPAAICQAIRAGRVTVTTTPLSEFRAASIFSRMLWGGARGRLRSARARRRRG